MNLIEKSIQVIREGQSPGGAYIACPSFPTYGYCWLRDGSFIAYAMDTAGQHDSSAAFFRWVHHTLTANAAVFEDLIQAHILSQEPSCFAPARYRIDGSIEQSDWPNFQLDGYGTWLWALSEHIGLTGELDLIDTYGQSIALTVEYLKHYWNHENYDCWEENGDKIHTSTLGCIYGGLKSINQYLKDPGLADLIDSIRFFIVNTCIKSGRLVKYIGSDQVDASLLWLCMPFRVFSPDSPVMKETVREIEAALLHSGGLHRYAQDTYYGGGEWLLLSNWLGWYYSTEGDLRAARGMLDWVSQQAEEDGLMPEQVLNHANYPSKINEWVERWGKVAKPLLWSHAMYIILDKSLCTR